MATHLSRAPPLSKTRAKARPAAMKGVMAIPSVPRVVGGWLPGLGYEAGGWPASLAFVVAMLAIMATIVAIFWKGPRPAAS